MARVVGNNEKKESRIELTNTDRSLSLSCRNEIGNDYASQWAEIERLPTFERLRCSLFDEKGGAENSIKGKRVVDVTKLSASERHSFIEKLIKHIENDNFQLLQKLRKRIDRVGVELPTVEVRYQNLRVEAECEVFHGNPLPTLWNSLKSIVLNSMKLFGLKSKEAKITIIDDVSGIIKPGRLALLLGPPGCGKTTLLKALAGCLDKTLKVAGGVSYNGYKMEEFIPQKTSAYISQVDLHIPQMTVRETLEFSAECQGSGIKADIMSEVIKREKQAGIVPDPDVDAYMKAISVGGEKANLQIDYILKIIGLDNCADTLVGDAIKRGISGGEKKRLTTAEMIVGPKNVFFMDEISNGLDSSTTYQIVVCLQQLAHVTDATIFLALLQPAPDVFELFDDIVLMAEGKIVYNGPRSHVLQYFEECGFRCPQRKGVADFLQEIISPKDQGQYWHETEASWSFISADMFAEKFKRSSIRKKLDEELLKPFVRSQSHKEALSFSTYSVSKWAFLRACMSREFLLMKRNLFIYLFKSVQLIILSFITMTVLIRTRMHVDVFHANDYMGALFYGLLTIFNDGFPEVTMTVARLPVFFKQRDFFFYPAWAYVIPAAVVKVPVSLLQSLIWTSLTYYVIGFSPEAGRFLRHFLLVFAVHLTATSLYRFIGSVFRKAAVSLSASTLALFTFLLFGGFIISKPFMPSWLKWGFWVSPLAYGEIGLVINEFHAPRWEQALIANTTLGKVTLKSRGLDFQGYFFWVSFVVLLGFIIIYNFLSALALSFLNAPGSRSMVSVEKLYHIEGKLSTCPQPTSLSCQGRVVLPFEPITLVFQDVQYYVDIPLGMREKGVTKKNLQLLYDVTGVLRPGVLTALMGVSGAGKTTLLDVLSGRKTSGKVKGNIRIGGYHKVQETFARVSGYCEQTDIHSPHITVEESVVFSAWMRLNSEIDSKTKSEFVKQVLEIIELDEIKDCLVGIPGVSGLSTEQRKRLTVAVELVANPSVIFMDEPTTGLDARAAAIVMRAVKNVADTGRTIVCTIHQPSINIFEAFDELILLKAGGHVIYCGPLGQNSTSVIKYFEDIPGVPKIKNNYNPATWMLEVTSASSESEIGVDFANVYGSSVLCQNNIVLVNQLINPPPGSKELHFPTRYSQNGWGQFKSCLWKHQLSYWKNPSYNLTRLTNLLVACSLPGTLCWDKGRNINNQQDLLSVVGSMYIILTFLGISNCASVLPIVSMERSVLYRERFAGMYSSWAYALAQVTVEVPYILAQAVAFVILTYPMIGYHWSAYKVFWYFYSMLCSVMTFNYVGMSLVAITPNLMVASTVQSAYYMLQSLFSGFFIPQPRIPEWWLWMYYLTPFSWALKGMATSQYGDVNEEIMVFGETKLSVSTFLRDYYGFHHDDLSIVALALIAYPIVFAFLFAFCIEKLNFQRR